MKPISSHSHVHHIQNTFEWQFRKKKTIQKLPTVVNPFAKDERLLVRQGRAPVQVHVLARGLAWHMTKKMIMMIANKAVSVSRRCIQ